MSYKRIIVTKRGGPETLQIDEQELRAPLTGEVRIKILATPVCAPDIQARYGQVPIAPKLPFVPGYAVIGNVEEIGEGVTTVAVGDRVGALPAFGGYAEQIYLKQGALISVPLTLPPAEAATLLLNYLVAYQVLHRAARVRVEDKVLIIGASGGVGTALLQLGRLADLKMYGIASKSKHEVLAEYGATPIDYHTQDFVEVVQLAEPEGLHAIFDGMGGDYVARGLSVLRRGGTLVVYGNPMSFSGLLRLLAKLLINNVLPNGKTVKLYGTTASLSNRRQLHEDWTMLFRLLEAGTIRPIIMAKFPLLEAAQANALLESGKVIGNVVLLSPELLSS